MAAARRAESWGLHPAHTEGRLLCFLLGPSGTGCASCLGSLGAADPESRGGYFAEQLHGASRTLPVQTAAGAQRHLGFFVFCF